MPKKRFIFWIFITLFSISVTYLWWVIIGFLKDYKNIPPDHLIGNKLSHLSRLKEEGFPFSFLVLGDTQGTETAETLIEMALKKDKPSFMIILGDFVKKPDIWNHRFFLTEMIAEIKPSFPVFLVPGNHDIDYKDSKIKERHRRVTPEVYESLYGVVNFDFIYNECLFILCGVDLKSPHLFLDYLRNTLEQKSKGKRHIFIFIHYPPKGLDTHFEEFLLGQKDDEFFKLMEDYKVTTCFFGHYHGYWRGERNGVRYIVLGGGGGRLKKSQPEWGKFHHILKITVDSGKLSENIISIPKQFELEDKFEEVVFTCIFPMLGTHERNYYLILGSLIGILGIFLFKTFRLIWPRRLKTKLSSD